MLNKAQRLFYAIVISLSVLVSMIALSPSPVAACGAGSCGGTGGILTITKFK